MSYRSMWEAESDLDYYEQADGDGPGCPDCGRWVPHHHGYVSLCEACVARRKDAESISWAKAASKAARKLERGE